jgi:uncharacterized protein YbjT (DUF2867 family)
VTFQGGHPAGLHRRRDQSLRLAKLGIRPVAGDLMSMGVLELAAQCAGMDTIVFAAGASDAGSSAADAVDSNSTSIIGKCCPIRAIDDFSLKNKTID